MRALLVSERTLRDRRVSFLWWGIGSALYSIMIVAIWPVIDGNDSFQDLADDYPEALQAMFGGADAFAEFTTPTGYLNTYLFAMILPFILTALAVSIGAAVIAGEEESGVMDLLLAYPVSRRSAVSQKAFAVVVGLLALGTLEVLVVGLVGPLVDLHIGWSGLIAATVGTLLFALFNGLLAMLAGSIRGQKGFAMGLAWGVAIGGYLLSILANLASELDFLKYASPLYHATAGNPVANGMPANYLILLGASGVLFVATLAAFDRHDLS
jgi:ABC-2 type transport system permease protein